MSKAQVLVLATLAAVIVGLATWWSLSSERTRIETTSTQEVKELEVGQGLPGTLDPSIPDQRGVASVPFTPESEVDEEAHAVAAGFADRPSAKVEGRVLNESGKPLVGVEVRYGHSLHGTRSFGFSHPPLRASVRTDPEGRFRLASVPMGSALRILARPDELRDAEMIVEIADTSDRNVGDLVCLPGGAVSGIVRDRAGAPVPLATVTANLQDASGPSRSRIFFGPHGGRPSEPGRTTTTDEAGRFRISGLAEGQVTVGADGPLHLAAEVQGITVVRGEERRDVLIELARGEALAGSVVDKDGKAVGGAKVTARLETWNPTLAGDESRPLSVVAKEDGTFRIDGLRPASYRLTASRPGFASGGDAVATPGGEAAKLQLEKAGILKGRITGPDGAPVLPESVSVIPDDGSPFGRFGRTGRVLLGKEAASELGIPDEPGLYAVADLPAAPVRIEASANGCMPESAGPVTIEPGVTATLDIALEAELAVAGRVVDAKGRPVAGAEVTVTSAEPESAEIVLPGGRGGERVAGSFVRRSGPRFSRGVHRASFTDAAGRFRAGMLGEGKYEVMAHHLLHGQVSQQVSLSIAAPVAEVALAMPGVGSVEGRVLDAEGRPLPLAKVSIRGREAEGIFNASERLAVADQSGGFLVPGLVPGAYTASFADSATPASFVAIALDGDVPLKPGAVAFEVEADKAASVVLRQVRKGSIKGRVLEGGSGAEGVRVRLNQQAQGGIDFGALGGGPETTTATDGSFEFQDVQPGAYQVTARTPKSGFPAKGSVDIQPGQQGSVTLDLPTGRIKGRVLEKGTRRPFSGVGVRAEMVAQEGRREERVGVFAVMAPSEGDAAGPAVFSFSSTDPSVTSDENGNFEICHVPPGRYALELKGGEAREAKSGEIEVETGSIADAGDLEVERGATLAVRVEVEPGAPRPFMIAVRHVDEQDGPPQHRAVMDQRPSMFHGLAPGTHTVTVHGESDVYPREEQVEVRSGERNETTIRVPAK